MSSSDPASHVSLERTIPVRRIHFKHFGSCWTETSARSAAAYSLRTLQQGWHSRTPNTYSYRLNFLTSPDDPTKKHYLSPAFSRTARLESPTALGESNGARYPWTDSNGRSHPKTQDRWLCLGDRCRRRKGFPSGARWTRRCCYFPSCCL